MGKISKMWQFFLSKKLKLSCDQTVWFFQVFSTVHQLPRDTLWVEWVKPFVLFLPPTSDSIVTESTFWVHSFRSLKLTIFKIGFFLIRKSKTDKTNTCDPILGGCWRQKVFSVFGFGHWKSHFWARESGHFWQKCPLLGTKKWHFGG